MKDRYAQARTGARYGMLGNALLFAVKLYAGIFANSMALVADAIHSLTDVVTSGFVYVGLWVSELPNDRNHPYGHTKAESILGSNVALLLILSSGWLLYEAYDGLGKERALPGMLALIAAGISIVVKEGLFQWKIRLGRRVGSISIQADAWHHRTDAFSSVCVLISLAAILYLGPAYTFIDSIAVGVVAITILVAGVKLYKESLADLMDARVTGPIVEEIRDTAQHVEGVADIEKLHVRKAGMEYSVDIHVEVDAQLNVADSHEIASRVRDTVVREITPVRQVLVHIEPHTLGGGPDAPHRDT